MGKAKFGVAVAADLMQQLEEMKDECEDIEASRSEIVEDIITIYFQADLDHLARVRETTIRRRKGNL